MCFSKKYNKTVAFIFIFTATICGCKDKIVEQERIELQSLSVSPTFISLIFGGTPNSQQMRVTTLPENATDVTFEWMSENKSVATVSSTGLVTAAGVGTTFITVIANDQKRKDVQVRVIRPEEPTYVDDGTSLFALAATDALGRVLPGHAEVGDIKPNKQVGVFYFLWMASVPPNYWDLSELVAAYPEVLEDYHHPHWGAGGMYYWGKPIYGYYRSDDYWVALRSIQLLTDAMVDFVVIDATNTYVYEKQADVLMKAMDAVRTQGKNPPKIVFYTNTSSGATMQKAYDYFYRPSASYRHPECWYYLDNKPLIIGISKEAQGTNYEQFFTYRESQWPNEDQKINGWPWISFTRPQKAHYNSRGEEEIISVSVAQHPNWQAGMGGSAFYGNTDNWGRSYRNNSHGDPSVDLPYGYNFQEQWDFALTQNTRFIFITGWNEWIAGKFPNTDGNPNHSYFCDQASPEYSRDIEPTLTADLKDSYYMQMVANIRRFKGFAPVPEPSPAKTILTMNEWEDVSPVYFDYINDTFHRNHRGTPTQPSITYTNQTGRNDFHILKVARDEQNIYFYAKTVDNITPCQGDNWMRLYIDADRNSQTGWNGYDYRVIEGKMLQRYENNVWTNMSQINCLVDNKNMMMTLSRNDIGLSSAIDIEFKWSDNMQEEDPLDWYLNGDVAPGGRFNYVYSRSLKIPFSQRSEKNISRKTVEK